MVRWNTEHCACVVETYKQIAILWRNLKVSLETDSTLATMMEFRIESYYKLGKNF